MARQQLKQKGNIQCFVHNIEQKQLIQRLMHEAAYFYDSSMQENLSPKGIMEFREKAKNTAYQILSIQEDNSDTLNLLARIALDEGQINRAGTLIDRAIKITPDSASYLYSQGHIYLAKQDYCNAEKSFTLAIHSSPTTTRAKSSLAYTKFQQGKYTEAFNNYRQLISDGHEDSHIKSKLFECIKNIQADAYDKELEKDLIIYYHLKEVDHTALANITSSLLLHKYRDIELYTSVTLMHFVEDTLLNLALEKTYFQDIVMETLIKDIRKKILLKTMQENHLDDSITNLVVNIAIHGFNNEYVYSYTEEEHRIIQHIEKLIKSVICHEHWEPNDIIGGFLLIAMYKPITQASYYHKIINKTLESWPQYIRKLVNLCIYQKLEEQQIQASIPCLEEIKRNCSQQVKQQYEENPYPRWLSLNYYTPNNYGQALCNELPHIKLPDFFKNTTSKILIAGCGTGKHALQVAKYFRNVDVLAVDISRTSLGYAKKMAEQLKIYNIQFLHADILDLDKLDKKFHIIECSGVLHHMQEPIKAWRILKELLVSHGILKIGLYSRYAREELEQLKHSLKITHPVNNLKDIIEIRYKIIKQANPIVTAKLFSTPDFYTSSAFRDLFLHCHEDLYTIPDIKNILKKLELRFLGFINIHHSQKEKYDSLFPQDSSRLNLYNWHKFEQDHKNLFSGMYQFYCQPLSEHENVTFI